MTRFINNKEDSMKLLRISPIVVVISFVITILACQDSLTDPEQIRSEYPGVAGKVRNEEGKLLQGVKVYCLFQFYNVTESNTPKSLPKIPTEVTNFDFVLEQNTPNPIINSTYLHFALPVKSKVEIKIINPMSGKTIYQQRENLSEGLYQRCLENIVDSLNMRNGKYEYSIRAEGIDGNIYEDKKEMFVISNKGKANCVTDKKGYFKFKYPYAFQGDSICVNYSDSYGAYYWQVTPNVNFLFEKEGYISRTVPIYLYDSMVLSRDVVLKKEDEDE